MTLTAKLTRPGAKTFGELAEDWALQFKEAPALSSPLETLSYESLALRMRRYARWAEMQGAGPGVVFGLLMRNRPDYLAAWMGVGLTGGATALLNTELPAPSLAHCLTASAVCVLIVEPSLIETAQAACAQLADPPALWVLGDVEGAKRLDTALEHQSDAPLPARPAISLSSPALHIFTSGTTGLPKAAIVSHRRVLSWAGWFAGMADTTADDVMYDCLPLFHSVGGVAATGAVLLNGGKVVLRERFSASAFWEDIRSEGCTLFQYIGELCRYLLAQPQAKSDQRHDLRMIIGNGLRPDVWSAFVQRFAPGRVLEFYAATEGVFTLCNAEGRVGALGRFPPFVARNAPAELVRLDPVTGDIARDETGRAIRCEPGEPGEAVGRIDPARGFDGYADKAASAAKLARDLFSPGDLWFRTGDLMRKDAEGFFYFVDRLGDTFRWKGENVATTEVASAVSCCPGVIAATVFGVSVEGREGRAGMAVLSPAKDFDLIQLEAELAARLPTYARPVFLRLSPTLSMTETLKHRSADYQTEGFDPDLITDPLYWRDPQSGCYARLDRALYQRIIRGQQAL